MTLPTHVLGVELLKLIIRSKDPFPPKFYCHSCKQKFSIPITPTSPVSTRVFRWLGVHFNSDQVHMWFYSVLK